MKRLLAIALLVSLAAACDRKTPCKKPEEVVSTFYQSMRYGDTPMAFKLITGSDRRALVDRAEEISSRTNEKIEPHELLVPRLTSFEGDILGATFKPVGVEVGDVREIEVTFRDETSVRTPVAREAGCYRISLGLAE
jgi:hypothetical protein